MTARRALVAAVGAFAAAVSSAASSAARADDLSLPGERVLSFRADVTVNEDASLDVVETIRVRALGRRVVHGIYRDFPVRSGGFVRFNVPFEVREVRRDGQVEPYTVEAQGRDAHVKIGVPGVHLEHGEHTYVIAYWTTRQLRGFVDHDELYWNVTGNGWVLPIDVAFANVHLPARAAARMDKLEGYTGRAGSKEHDLWAERVGDVASFETTRPLSPGEGLTIVVTWPKGLVRVLDGTATRAVLLADNHALFAGAGGALALALYVAVVGLRRRRARDEVPVPSTAVPPEGLSPAALRYIVRMGFDDDTFTAALLSLADKGYLSIQRDGDGTYAVQARAGATAALAPEEEAVRDVLFIDGGTLRLARANATTISGAQGVLRKRLRDDYRGAHFFRDSRTLALALLLSIGVMVVLAAGLPGAAASAAAFLTVWLTVWSLGVALLVYAAVKAWQGALKPRAPASAWGGAVFMTLFAGVFGAAEVFVFWAYSTTSSGAQALVLATVLAIAFRVVTRSSAPTPLGLRVQQAARGYRRFLEADAMARTDPTGERLLSYAFALGAVDAWTRGLGTAAALPIARPDWWSGTPWNSSSLGDFTSSLPSAVSSSSSSGSGGGGSSGGGGGGGGGGGW